MDTDIAKEHLDGHSICLCRDGEYFTDDGRGISPMMRFISQGRDLSGYSAADLIVGKAAAMLFVRAGIVSVYARVISEGGYEFLKAHGIVCTYDTLTERIINRQGTDICPMERTVLNIDDIEEGYKALQKKSEELREPLNKSRPTD